MFKNTDADGQIFRDELYLTSNYKPSEPVDRCAEIGEIADYVQRTRSGRGTGSLLVHGPVGTGKSTCVDHVLQKTEEETLLKTISLNCWQYNTRPALLTELLIQIGYPAPRKGKPIDELLSKIREWLDKKRGVVIALDEFDKLDHQSEIVYDLHMINQESENPLGQILISNQRLENLQLEPRSESRLNHRELEFEFYDKDSILNILQDRAEQAFLPGAVPQECLELIAEKSREIGDCREAIGLLFRAGRRAEDEGVNQVTPKIVEREMRTIWSS